MTCRPDGVSIVDVRGPVTPAVLQQMRDDLLVHVQRPLRALCLRLDKAMVAVSGDQLDAVLDWVRPRSVLAADASIAVAPEVFDLFSGHAWRMAERGHVRTVFTSPGDALLWATAQARLAKAQADWEAARAMAHCPSRLSGQSGRRPASFVARQ